MRALTLSAALFFVAAQTAPLWAQQHLAVPESGEKESAKRADSGKDSKEGKGDKGDAAQQKPSVTEHTIQVGGKTLKYKATAGYLILKNEEAKAPGEHDGRPEPDKEGLRPKAKIFYVAYTLEGADPAKRPLTFAFNGGPGAASVWLHMGALGPKRVKMGPGGDGSLPPYELVDNEFTWLADSDLVFVDPVSTGYSRPIPIDNGKAFHGFREDLQSMAETIRTYTTENNRWLSPKILVGESYGGLRVAGLARLLEHRFDIYVNGIAVVSGLLNWQVIDFHGAGNDLPYSLFLPGYTAAAWYHKKLPADLQNGTEADALKKAEEFASGDYLLALAKGSSLSAEKRAEIAKQIAQLTGITEEAVLRYNLRVPPDFYMDELLRKDQRSIGRFDSRLTGIAYDANGADFDPSFATMQGNFTSAINSYLRSDLKFETELPYQSLVDVSPWNFAAENRYLDVSEELGRAMAESPHMKVWFVAGHYDLAISYYATDYALRHIRLDPAIKGNLRFTTYETGHMPYTDEVNLKGFRDDFANFLKGATER
jgi:carboxypeptidase C (cathepsin A)